MPNKSAYAVNRMWSKPGPYETHLEPHEVPEFQSWVKSNKVPYRHGDLDYDMQGFWKALKQGDPRAHSALARDGRIHFPDVWKTPYHQSFSNESIYATPDAPGWEKKPDGRFVLKTKDGKVIFSE